MDPVVIGAAVGAWGTVMAAILQRTNGHGPMGKKLDCVAETVDRIDRRTSRLEYRVDRMEDGV